MIDTSTWREFNLKDICYITMGNKMDFSAMTMDNPTVNFVGRSADDNGVVAKVDAIKDVKPYNAGCITVALGGSLGSSYLQIEPFYTSQNVAVLEFDDTVSDLAKIFISCLIMNESKYKYFPFGRELNTHIRTDFSFALPIRFNADGTPFIDVDKRYSENGYVPDWQFMEDFIGGFHSKPLTTSVKSSHIPLEIERWREFKVGDLFDIHPTKAIDGVSADDCVGYGYPLVVNSAENNGVAGLCDIEPTENGNIITFSDTTDGNTFFYQPSAFIGFAHVQGMYPKNSLMTASAMLFISTMLMFNSRGRYSYGRKMRRDAISESLLKLPATPSGTPDWQFMEDYVKSLPYGDKL